MSLTGTWNLSIATPVGTQSVALELTENNGVVAGIAKGNAESTPSHRSRPARSTPSRW
jgi:hypothetical protein